MEINGVAHTFVTVGDFDRARAFYSELLPFLGLKNVMDIPGTYYCVGGRTGFAIREAPDANRGARFEQGRVGLHHICFRARSREDVESGAWVAPAPAGAEAGARRQADAGESPSVSATV